MGIFKAVSSGANLRRAINYVTDPKKSAPELISGKDCDPERAAEDMQKTKQAFGKEGGREYKHYVQSFSPDEQITPEEAHKIAVKMAEKSFPGHEVLIATHIDKDHIHSHLIVNSVNFENGRKLHMSNQDLQNLKDYSDQLCRDAGKTVCEKGIRNEIDAPDAKKYRALERGIKGEYKSYVLDCHDSVNNARKNAINRADFIEKMEEKGYKTTWTDERKYITFEDKEGNRIRNSNLEKTFKNPCGKEDLEHEFARNDRLARSSPGIDIEKQRAEIEQRGTGIDQQNVELTNRRKRREQLALDEGKQGIKSNYHGLGSGDQGLEKADRGVDRPDQQKQKIDFGKGSEDFEFGERKQLSFQHEPGADSRKRIEQEQAIRRQQNRGGELGLDNQNERVRTKDRGLER